MIILGGIIPMSYKIIADTSSNVYKIEGVNFAYAPMKIITSEKEFVDEHIIPTLTLVSASLRTTLPLIVAVVLVTATFSTRI